VRNVAVSESKHVTTTGALSNDRIGTGTGNAVSRKVHTQSSKNKVRYASIVDHFADLTALRRNGALISASAG
jgi:hypothetical protein